MNETKNSWLFAIGFSATAFVACVPANKVLGNTDLVAGATAIGAAGRGSDQGGAGAKGGENADANAGSGTSEGGANVGAGGTRNAGGTPGVGGAIVAGAGAPSAMGGTNNKGGNSGTGGASVGGAGGVPVVAGAGGRAGSSGRDGAGGSTHQDPLYDACVKSGGTVTTAQCCNGDGWHDFPNGCAVGACGCSPQYSKPTLVCSCPGDSCFDGNTCAKRP